MVNRRDRKVPRYRKYSCVPCMFPGRFQCYILIISRYETRRQEYLPMFPSTE